jgi:hypothetical protein
MVIRFYDQFVCYWKWNTTTRDLSTSSTAKVVQKDTHKNLDEKLTLYNIQGHFNSSIGQIFGACDVFGLKSNFPLEFHQKNKSIFHNSLKLGRTHTKIPCTLVLNYCCIPIKFSNSGMFICCTL